MLKKLIAVAMSTMFMLSGCAKVEDSYISPPPSETASAVSAEETAKPINHPDNVVGNVTEPTQPTEEETTLPEPKEPDIRRIHLVCAGDNLIHSSIYNQAARRAKANGKEGYDFSYVYEKVEKYISGADVAILNQETIVTDELEPSDYPRFCSPADLGEHMISMGFNVFSISNNHVLDKGEAGLLATLDYWDSHEGIIRYGAYRNQEDMDNIRAMEVNGITLAFLGYMEHTNGLSLPEDSECRLTYLSELEEVERQVRLADEMADVVIVSPHYGKETINEQTENQLFVTDKLFEWGADLIIGTQPHTAQKCEYHEKPDGSRGFVYYCLGNFVSAQSRYKQLVGIIGDLEIVKNMDTGEIMIENPKAIPIITQYGYNYSNIHIEPYCTYTEELVNAHGCDEMSMKNIEKVLSYIPEEYLAIE